MQQYCNFESGGIKVQPSPALLSLTGGNFTFATRPVLRAVVVFLANLGLRPAFMRPTDGVVRVFYPNPSLVVFNHTCLEEIRRMGLPTSAVMIDSADPLSVAEELANMLRRMGFEASVMPKFEPSLPFDLVALHSNAFNNAEHFGRGYPGRWIMLFANAPKSAAPPGFDMKKFLRLTE